MENQKTAKNFDDYLALLKHYADLHTLTAEEEKQLSAIGGVLFQRGATEAKNKAMVGLAVAIFNLGYECGQKASRKANVE